MNTKTINYNLNEQQFTGYLAQPENSDTSTPLVLICHDWSGCNDFAQEKARWLAELGYAGFAIDIYGEGKQGKDNEEKMALMGPLFEDRTKLRAHLLAALTQAESFSNVDQSKIAVMGFCFGGLCALDLARASSKIKAAVSFHGFLDAPKLDNSALSAKVLVAHGYKDPMVTADTLNPFYQEMDDAGVDWQVHVYGQAKHAFTNPLAADEALGTVYDVASEQRSMRLLQDFLAEI